MQLEIFEGRVEFRQREVEVFKIKCKILCNYATLAVLWYFDRFVLVDSTMIGENFENIDTDIPENAVKLHFSLIEDTKYFKENQER